MTALAKVIRAEIIRLSKKEARGLVAPTSRSAAAARRDIATLKRRIADLERELARVKKVTSKPPSVSADTPTSVIRYSGKGVRALRERFGMSSHDFGKLLEVSSQAIYNWEQGIARPRPALLKELVALRALGKREAAAKARALDVHGG